MWWYFSINIFFLFFFLSFHFHSYTVSIHVLFLFFFFLFLVFLLHTSVQSPFFYFLFHLNNIPASHICFTSEREIKRSSKGQSQWRSTFTMQHYHVRHPTAARRPPHHQAGSDRLVFFFSSFSFFFFHICLFWFNFILRIGFCFVFYVWIMWEMERIRGEKKIRRREKDLI